MKTSLFLFPDHNQSYTKVIDYVKEMSFEAIELYRACELITPNAEAAKRIRDYAEHANIQVSCLSIGANLLKRDNKDEIARLKEYVDVAKAVGTPFLHHTLGSVMHIGGCGISLYSIFPYLIDALRDICDYAGEQGIMILNENQGFLTNGISFFEELIGRLEHENHGLVADLGNILFIDTLPETFVGRFAPYIKHLHVKDYLMKPGEGLFPGEEWVKTRGGNYLYNTLVGYGVVAFEKVFKLLADLGYSGYYSMECSHNEGRAENLKKGLRNMRRYFENAYSERKDIE